jgi:hypothetical protein
LPGCGEWRVKTQEIDLVFYEINQYVYHITMEDGNMID